MSLSCVLFGPKNFGDRLEADNGFSSGFFSIEMDSITVLEVFWIRVRIDQRGCEIKDNFWSQIEIKWQNKGQKKFENRLTGREFILTFTGFLHVSH